MSNIVVKSLVKQLEAASEAYYNSSTPTMTDEEYDMNVAILQNLDPDNAFLKVVGPKPQMDTVKLPYPMPSLRKLHPDSLSSWRAQGPFIASDKLDGVSALWIPSTQKLYLRGNGEIGQDVSHIVPHINGLRTPSSTTDSEAAIRGELIVPKSILPNARNWVNGVLHQKKPELEDLEKIQFVAYQVVVPKMLRSIQMRWLMRHEFLVVPWTLLNSLDVAEISALFMDRRNNSPYECDGIVLGQERIYEVPKDTSDPKDSMAFKMPTESQRAETTVVDIEWNSSKGGIWIPRIRIQPVKIGHATIEWCTGHSANNIWSEGIGPGAKLIIRRSGDVIPYVEKVLQKATAIKMPPDGRWVWDDSHVHAKDTTTELTDEKLAQILAHMCAILGVEGYSETSLLKVVKAGIKTPQQLLKTTADKLSLILGPTLGPRLLDKFTISIKNASPEQWIQAWTGWSRGFGLKRIKACLALEPDVAKWAKINTKIPEGMSETSFGQVKQCLPDFLKWRESLGYQEMNKSSETNVPQPSEVKGFIVLSGFRDQNLVQTLNKRGYFLLDTVTKQTTHLIVADSKESAKTKTAKKYGIPILSREAALSSLL